MVLKQTTAFFLQCQTSKIDVYNFIKIATVGAVDSEGLQDAPGQTTLLEL